MTEATPEANRIERDLEHTRSRLDATIDALQQKLSPGEIFEQALDYMKESGGGEFGRNLVATMRDNPVPVALVGIGLAWLMVAGPREGSRRDGRGRGELLDAGAGPERGYGGAVAETDRYPARDERWDEAYLSRHGAYASAAIEDLATKANEAGTSVRRDPNEAEDAYQERVYAAKGGVLGLRRNTDETHPTFRERVDAAIVAAAQRYERMRAQAMDMKDDLAARGQSAMQSMHERGRSTAGSVYDYGRSAAEGAYGYGQAAVETAYDYGYGAARSLREHPLPYVLIGAGVAWLLMSGRNERDDRRFAQDRYDRGRYGPTGRYSGYQGAGYGRAGSGIGYDYAGEPVEDLAGRAHAAGSGVERAPEESEDAYHGRVYAAKARVMGLAQDMGESLAAFRERVDAALEAAGERYRAWRDQARTAGGDMASRGQGAVQSLYGYGRSAADGAYSLGGRTAGYVQDQPLLLGAIGASIGACLAMLMPPSRYEREMMAGVREDVRERIRDAASDAVHGAGRVAREVMGTAREAAEREGLGDFRASGIAQAARERVHEAAERVRHVVEETAAAGREAVERELKGEQPGGNGTGEQGGRGEPAAQAGGGSYGRTPGNGDKRTPA